MKGEYIVILAASICAVLVGIIDAAVDSYFFHSGSFLDLLLFNIPFHDLVFRIIIVIFLIAMGIVSAFFTKMRRLEREQLQRDITERKKMEEELQIRAEMLDNATDSIILLDRSGTILYANKIACESRGYQKEELIGQNIMLLGIPEQVINTPDSKATDAAKNAIWETVNQRKDGSIFPIEVNSKIILQDDRPYTLSVIRDISSRKQIQDQLIITDRLSSLGNLVLSLSHELNNPLSSVIGYAQLLLSNKELTQPVINDIEKILSQARRVADIIRNFNEFGTESSSDRQKVDISSTVSSVLAIRKYELNSKNIIVNTSFEPDLPQVWANTGQLLQVFLDLILNAEFFMHEAHQKGILTITTKKVDDMVIATIADDGPGIKPENLSHILDPFYTTKEVGKGTGLGLTIAYRIITDHGGKLDIRSQPDQGTTVIIQLPIAQDMVYNK